MAVPTAAQVPVVSGVGGTFPVSNIRPPIPLRPAKVGDRHDLGGGAGGGYFGGGGGGSPFGGEGGSGGGGAGGSAVAAAAITSPVLTLGVNTGNINNGNGQVTITWNTHSHPNTVVTPAPPPQLGVPARETGSVRGGV